MTRSRRLLIGRLLLLPTLSLTVLSHAQQPADTASATDTPPQRPVFVSRDPDELRESAVNFFMPAQQGQSVTPGGSSAPPRGCGSGSIRWDQNHDPRDTEVQIPGLYHAVLIVGCYRDREVVFWSDLPGALTQAQPSRSSLQMDGDGNFLMEGWLGQWPYLVSGNTTMRGIVVIGHHELELGDGQLILVSTRESALSVKQLAYDLAGMTANEIQDLANEDPEIREFFRSQQIGN